MSACVVLPEASQPLRRSPTGGLQFEGGGVRWGSLQAPDGPCAGMLRGKAGSLSPLPLFSQAAHFVAGCFVSEKPQLDPGGRDHVTRHRDVASWGRVLAGSGTPKPSVARQLCPSPDPPCQSLLSQPQGTILWVIRDCTPSPPSLALHPVSLKQNTLVENDGQNGEQPPQADCENNPLGEAPGKAEWARKAPLRLQRSCLPRGTSHQVYSSRGGQMGPVSLCTLLHTCRGLTMGALVLNQK